MSELKLVWKNTVIGDGQVKWERNRPVFYISITEKKERLLLKDTLFSMLRHA